MATKATLAKKLVKFELSQRASVLWINVFLKALAEALSKGERIELRGFGTFYVARQAARKTSINGNMTVPEHGRVVFQPCEALRRAAWGCGKGNAAK